MIDCKLLGATALATLMLSQGALAQTPTPASELERGTDGHYWLDPAYGEDWLADNCENPPEPFGFDFDPTLSDAPPFPELPGDIEGIEGVLEDGVTWDIVWQWEGNNVDGAIAGADGNVIFANNDAGNVMEMDPQTGMASIIHEDINSAGAVARNKNGALFVAQRGLPEQIIQLEPERTVLADSYNGEPFECLGGIFNDITAHADGGVYVSVSGFGVLHVAADGTVTPYEDGVAGANGIILSADETTLYVGAGPEVVAFDVAEDGTLSNQRVFGQLESGAGDGSAVDSEGRLYVAADNVNVFSPEGERLGVIPAPEGTHLVWFGGADNQTLFGGIFYGDWGAPSSRNGIVALPTLAQGLEDRAK